jgi:Arc/MetJ-type ribon-helix-helix transcriptional regulator
MSEFLREAIRRYVQTQCQPSTLAEALQVIREDARQKRSNRLTRNDIDAEIAAYRSEQRGKKKVKRPA